MTFNSAFNAPGQFYKGNIHTHSTRSDGAHSPEQVCEFYKAAGYDFLAVTDHFVQKFGFPIVDTSRFRCNNFTTIFGAEVHAPSTALGLTWHLLAVGLPLDFRPTSAEETATELAVRCIRSGAFLTIAHPAWYALSAADALTIKGAHAVEIYNHTSQLRTDRGDGTYLVDQLLAHGVRVNVCATDDAHFHCDDGLGGWVMVKASQNDPDTLLESLKAGNYYSTQGPVIEDVTWTSDSVTVHCSPASSVMVLGRGSLAAQENAPAQRSATLPLGDIREGGLGRIVVADEVGRRAWTNPIWFSEITS